jgi:cytochrome c
MDIEFNKIAGAVLGAGVFAMGVGLLSEAIFHQDKPEKPGYVIAVATEPSADAAAGAPADAAQVAPIAERLKSASPDAGKKVFAKCTSCHNADKGGKNATGPNLWAVVERPVAGHEGFAYSPAMVEHAKTNPKWTLDDLDHFLANPGKFVPKTKMGFAGLPKAEERANVIEFLRNQADSPVAVQ